MRSVLTVLAVLVVVGCGSAATSPVIGPTPVPTTPASATAPATPSAEPTPGAPATVPDPCTLLPKAAIDTILGGTADEGTPGELGYAPGLVCDFEANNGVSLQVVVETDFPTVSVFTDRLGFTSTAVPGLGEAAYYGWSDFGTPPGAILWIYAKGVAIGMHVYKPGLTDAEGLDLLKTLAASLPPR